MNGEKKKKEKQLEEVELKFSIKGIIIFLFICGVILFIGYWFMMHHLELEIEDGYLENRLREPYYFWVTSYSTFYIITAISLLLVTIFTILLKGNLLIVALSMILLALLAATRPIIDYCIALIKMNAGPTSLVILFSTLILALLLQTLPLYKQVKNMNLIRKVTWITVGVVVTLLLLIAPANMGDYIVVSNKSHQVEGTFMSKLEPLCHGAIGIAIFFM